MAKVGHRAIGASFAQVIRWGRKKSVVCRPEKRRKGRRRNGLIELAFDVGDALRNEIIGDFVFDSMGEDRLGGGGRGFGGSRAHVGKRLSLGLCDLALRHLGMPCNKFFDLGLGLGCKPLRLGLGAGNYCLRFLLGFVLLALVRGEQRFRFRLEPARLVQLRGDALPPAVDAFHKSPVRSDIRQRADEDNEGDSYPEFGFEHRRPQRLSTLLTAWATSSLAGATPVSRSTIAGTVSLAILCTFAIAADRVAAMVFSASAMCALSLASTSLRRASAAAAAFSRVSLARVCARERASASAFSCAAMAASDASLRRCASPRSPSIR